MRSLSVALILSVGLLALGCNHPPPDTGPVEPEQHGPPWFEDVTDRLGIDFVHDAGPVDGVYRLPQVIGSGVALFDFDGDGRLDLYFVSNGGPDGKPNRLYRQKPDGTFEDVSRGSGLDYAAHCMGVAVGDINNDGRPDLLVTEANGARLFLNLGGGKFRDVTKEAGVDNPTWGTAAAFLDYDRDGLLDLVIVNYVDFDPSWRCTATRDKPDYCSPNVFPPVIARLFHNLGEKDGLPKFQDVTTSSGLGRTPGPGLGVVCADFDGDGWVDIFVANDGKPNHLWINQKDGAFKEEGVPRGVAFNGMGVAQSGMGVGLGDVDGDGLFDLFITHLTIEQHTLWKQGPRGVFRDRSAEAKLTRPRWRGTGFGTTLADLDNDGWPDAVVVHGRVSQTPGEPYPPLGPHWGKYAERNQLLRNDGTGQFQDVSTDDAALCGTPNVARGLAVGDIDGDGALDLVVTTVNGRARVLRNMAPGRGAATPQAGPPAQSGAATPQAGSPAAGRGHWLKAKVLEASGQRFALGAEVSLKAGGRSYARVVRTAESFLSASDGVTHFGLGQAASYDDVEVLWPSGKPRRERFPGGAADRVVELRQGAGQAVAAPEEKP